MVEWKEWMKLCVKGRKKDFLVIDIDYFKMNLEKEEVFMWIC